MRMSDLMMSDKYVLVRVVEVDEGTISENGSVMLWVNSTRSPVAHICSSLAGADKVLDEVVCGTGCEVYIRPSRPLRHSSVLSVIESTYVAAQLSEICSANPGGQFASEVTEDRKSDEIPAAFQRSIVTSINIACRASGRNAS